MTPILLVVEDKRQVTSYIKERVKKNSILPTYVFEFEPEQKEISIDQIREIKKQVSLSFSQPRLFVLYEFGTASYQAQNAFLKTLEEHPENILFVLVVKSANDMLPTILSRTVIVDMRRRSDKALDDTIVKEIERVASGKQDFPLGSLFSQVKSTSDAVKTCDAVLLYFRSVLPTDPRATNALRETIKTRSLILHNNVNPQYSVDHLLIKLHKTYQKA